MTPPRGRPGEELRGTPADITARERASWMKRLQGVSLSSTRSPFRDSSRPGGQVRGEVHRPGGGSVATTWWWRPRTSTAWPWPYPAYGCSRTDGIGGPLTEQVRGQRANIYPLLSPPHHKSGRKVAMGKGYWATSSGHRSGGPPVGGRNAFRGSQEKGRGRRIRRRVPRRWADQGGADNRVRGRRASITLNASAEVLDATFKVQGSYSLIRLPVILPLPFSSPGFGL